MNIFQIKRIVPGSIIFMDAVNHLQSDLFYYLESTDNILYSDLHMYWQTDRFMSTYFYYSRIIILHIQTIHELTFEWKQRVHNVLSNGSIVFIISHGLTERVLLNIFSSNPNIFFCKSKTMPAEYNQTVITHRGQSWYSLKDDLCRHPRTDLCLMYKVYLSLNLYHFGSHFDALREELAARFDPIIFKFFLVSNMLGVLPEIKNHISLLL